VCSRQPHPYHCKELHQKPSSCQQFKVAGLDEYFYNSSIERIEHWRIMTNDLPTANKPSEEPAVFHARFWRCHRLLHLIACRVVGGSERADDAIANCWLTASRNPPRFEYDGAFRSWLVRVLMDEGLAILHKNQGSAEDEVALQMEIPSEYENNCTKTNCTAETAQEAEY
jgi:DNA-directed RNA polymerase specialized sigma24 family protein